MVQKQIDERAKREPSCPRRIVIKATANHDAVKVLDACRDAWARIPTHNKAAAVVLCSGYGESFGLHHFTEVFRVVQHAMDESAYLVCGVVFDSALVDAMSVTWLAGAPDG